MSRQKTEGGTEVEIINVPADSHCFFHAVRLLLEGLPDPHRGMAATFGRTELVEWMQRHLYDVMYDRLTLRDLINDAEDPPALRDPLGRAPNVDIDLYLTRMQFGEGEDAWAGTLPHV